MGTLIFRDGKAVGAVEDKRLLLRGQPAVLRAWNETTDLPLLDPVRSVRSSVVGDGVRTVSRGDDGWAEAFSSHLEHLDLAFYRPASVEEVEALAVDGDVTAHT